MKTFAWILGGCNVALLGYAFYVTRGADNDNARGLAMAARGAAIATCLAVDGIAAVIVWAAHKL